MVDYYRGPCARVTHTALVVHCPSYQRFALRELARLRVIEQDAGTLANEAIRSGSSVAGAVAVALAIRPVFGKEIYESPVVVALLLLVLIAAVVATGARTQRTHTRYWLVADYRGQRVTLLHTRDRREFEQVKRALVRALEHLDDTG